MILRHGGKFHFISAPLSSHPYHANIVFAFIQAEGRGEAVLLGGTHCKIVGGEWRVLGGGYYEADFSAKVFRLSGKSTAYGKYPLDSVARNVGAFLTALGFPDFQLVLA